MARDPQVISDSIDAELTARLAAEGVTLSASAVAEWKLWRDTAVNTDYSFEVVMDAFKADIQKYIDTKQLGSLSWYAEQAKKFQYGDNLLVSSEGLLYYAVIDPSKQIVKLASVKEDEDVATHVVTLVMKVATIDATTDEVQPLDAAQVLGFTDYMKNIKIVGTHLQIVSQNADSILYDVKIVYNPQYAQTNVEANILAALETFRTTYGFDPTFYRSAFEDAIQSAAGVVAVQIMVLQGTPEGGSPTDIDLDYELASGYFNYDAGSLLTLIPQ